TQRIFKICSNEAPVRDQHFQNVTNHLIVQRRRVSKHLERSDNVDGAKAGLHRNRPVWSETRRVRIGPRYELRYELLCVAVVPGQRICSSKRRQVLKPVQLPQHPDVGAAPLYQLNSCEMIRWPPSAREGIAMPVDMWSKLARAAEDRQLVSQYRICFDERL